VVTFDQRIAEIMLAKAMRHAAYLTELLALLRAAPVTPREILDTEYELDQAKLDVKLAECHLDKARYGEPT